MINFHQNDKKEEKVPQDKPKKDLDDETGMENVIVINAEKDPQVSYEPPPINRLDEIFEDQLKFSATIDTGKMIPHLGVQKWDGHIFVSGSTGSGKTWLIKEIILNDKKNRPVYLFTDIDEKDPSYKELWGRKKMKRVTFTPKEKKHEIHPDKTKNKNCICIFDDTKNEKFVTLRDKLLERGRHNNVVVICVSQKMRDRKFTKVPKTNSRWKVTFPKFDRMEVFRYLMEEGMNRKQAMSVINFAESQGRGQLIFHNFAPRFMITEQTFIAGLI